LAKYVGSSVTVKGTHHEGSQDLDVESVDGTALREEGRPPWAGGPRVVGESHPGWKGSSDKPGNGLGRDGAPGQGKKNRDNPQSE
jgi:hypothetical protein